MRNASNSEDERDEVYNENFSTTTQYGTAIEEVNVELYITQFIPYMLDAARSEDENDMDSEEWYSNVALLLY